MNAPLIKISEIFGPTIQGEGELIGTTTVFVRSGGCDFRCNWCDTAYAVLPEFNNQWLMMDSKAIFSKIEQLSDKQPLWITLSGGNPALQDFEALIRLGQKHAYKFSMETQGSIVKPWFSLLDQLTLSPKPPSSGMKYKPSTLQHCIKAYQANKTDKTGLSLKFVIANQDDLLWAKNLAQQYPGLPCFVQPCNTKASLLSTPSTSNTINDDKNTDKTEQKQLLELIQATQSLNWHNARILPQLHRWLWGEQPGV
jgi:7-carboxy-7-deazaguanine synthase